MKNAIKTKCACCGKEVTRQKRREGVYFCSRKCAMIYSGKTARRICGVCGKEFEVKKSAVKRGWGLYCSKECANKSLEITHHVQCEQCGKTFIGDKNNWKKQKYCSPECMQKAIRKPIDEELLKRLYIDEKLTSREIAQIIGRSKKVVIDYLKFYNIQVRPDGIKNRERIKCTDGHLVRSYYERAFDNLLSKNGIEHEYDVRLPFNKRFMADFKVNDVYVEIWGLMNISEYKKRRERKLELYNVNGCKLLEVFPDDFKNLQNKINELQSLMET